MPSKPRTRCVSQGEWRDLSAIGHQSVIVEGYEDVVGALTW